MRRLNRNSDDTVSALQGVDQPALDTPPVAVWPQSASEMGCPLPDDADERRDDAGADELLEHSGKLRAGDPLLIPRAIRRYRSGDDAARRLAAHRQRGPAEEHRPRRSEEFRTYPELEPRWHVVWAPDQTRFMTSVGYLEDGRGKTIR